MGILLYTNLTAQKSNMLEATTDSSLLLADSTYAGIMHPMSRGDNATVERQLIEAKERMAGVNVHIFNPALEVVFTSNRDRLHKKLSDFIKDQTLLAATARAMATGQTSNETFEELAEGHHKQAVFRPILNAEACFHCHGSSRKVLGGLMVRQVNDETYARLATLRNINLGASVAGMLIIMGLLYWLLTRMVIKPVKLVVQAAETFSSGDLTYPAQPDQPGRAG